LNERLLAARLFATRVTDEPGPISGELPRIYHAWHQELHGRLAQRFVDLQHSQLFVTCTANARSELVIGPGSRTIVHDQHLGRTLNRMTSFVVREWPASRVQSWAFERLATLAFVRGDLASTQLALAFASRFRHADEPPSADETLDRVRGLFVTAQEFFVLAHEVAHTALGSAAHERLEDDLREELDAELAHREAVGRENADENAAQLARDVATAVERHTGQPPPVDFEPPARLLRVEDGLDERAWLRAHRFLYEEVACDLIATELTLEHFAEFDPKIGPQTVLPAILMALHHLTSLEYLATVVDSRALELEATLQSTMVRKSVWRDMTRKMYEPEVGELGPMYVSATQHHARYLGDQVLFIVPGHWREAHELLAGRSRDDVPNAALLRDAVWSFANPG
jgi:hypothetical protein